MIKTVKDELIWRVLENQSLNKIITWLILYLLIILILILIIKTRTEKDELNKIVQENQYPV